MGWEASYSGGNGLGLVPNASGLAVFARNQYAFGDVTDSTPVGALELATVSWGPAGVILERRLVNGTAFSQPANTTITTIGDGGFMLNIGAPGDYTGPGTTWARPFVGDIAALQVYGTQLSPRERARTSHAFVKRWLGYENVNKTAQSIMIASSTPASFVMMAGETWEFDRNASVNADPNTGPVYYNNQWNGVAPTVECLDWDYREPCDPAGAPPAPGAPLPDTGQTSAPFEITNVDQCILFAGGALTANGTYVQPVYNYDYYPMMFTYNYSYTIAPAGTGVVPPRSSWVRTASGNSGGTVPVTIDATIASETVVRPSGAGPWTRQYNFSLLDNNNQSRVKDLKFTLTGTDADNQVVGPISSSASHTVQSNLADFVYTSNAESGNTDLLAARSTPPSDYFNAPSSALVSKILNGGVTGFDGIADNYAGNDSDVYFAANVHKAVMTPVIFNLGPGCYKASITGIIKKGNVVGSLDLNIGATKTVGISAGTCSTPVVTGGCQ